LCIRKKQLSYVGPNSHVRSLYQRYLELRCVSKLSAELNARGVTSKRRVSRTGVASGGVAYSRGALYALLKNRLYRGEVAGRSLYSSLIRQRMGLVWQVTKPSPIQSGNRYPRMCASSVRADSVETRA
jgi:hypothetical protein